MFNIKTLGFIHIFNKWSVLIRENKKEFKWEYMRSGLCLLMTVNIKNKKPSWNDGQRIDCIQKNTNEEI